MENDSLADALGQGPVTILEVDGKEYELAPLKMKDLAAVEKVARQERRREAIATIKEAGNLLKPDQISAMVAELSVESDSWLSFLGTPTGIEHVIVIRLRKSYPDMTAEEARELITMEAIANVSAEMAELVGIEAFGSGEDDSPPETDSG